MSNALRSTLMTPGLFGLGGVFWYLISVSSRDSNEPLKWVWVLGMFAAGVFAGLIFGATARLNNRGEWGYAARWMLALLGAYLIAVVVLTVLGKYPMTLAETALFALGAVVGGAVFATVGWTFKVINDRRE